MDVTIYLPDEIGTWAKENKLKLSRLLRDAVTAERERRRIMAETLSDVETHEVFLEDKDGRTYTGRITGRLIADDPGDIEVYLTVDERVLVYDGGRSEYWVLNNPVEQLRGWLTDAAYFEAITALGETPVVDL